VATVGGATDAEAADGAAVAGGAAVAANNGARAGGSACQRTGPACDGRRCDADKSPESREASDRSCDRDLDDDSSPEFDAELALERDNGPSPSPIFQRARAPRKCSCSSATSRITLPI